MQPSRIMKSYGTRVRFSARNILNTHARLQRLRLRKQGSSLWTVRLLEFLPNVCSLITCSTGMVRRAGGAYIYFMLTYIRSARHKTDLFLRDFGTIWFPAEKVTEIMGPPQHMKRIGNIKPNDHGSEMSALACLQCLKSFICMFMPFSCRTTP